MTPEEILEAVKKGAFKPHMYLTNLCLTHFQSERGSLSTKIFPTVPVQHSSAYYYEFDKGDLARDNMARKPEFGKVQPAIYGKREHTYHCQVDQVITGLDRISTLDYSRGGAPAIIDPRKAKARFIAEQMKLHSDILWAKSFFNEGAWGKTYRGTTSTPADDQFYSFDSENSDPVQFFNELSTAMVQQGLRMPNKMCLGANVYNALKINPSILERIKYNGSQANPANVTTQVLASLFDLEEIVVSQSVYNSAALGAEAKMEFVCSPNDALLTYTTNAPSIDEPSAGYTFAWDMLGDGNHMAVRQFEGEGGTHTEFIEGLMASDRKVTCSDLGVFLKNAANGAVTVSK